MNSKTLSNFHKFGKVGKIAMTVLMVIAILAAAASCAATIFVSALPKDALTVRVTNRIQDQRKEFRFPVGYSCRWFFLCGGRKPRGNAERGK